MSKSSDLDDVMAEFEAEDSAINYLAALPEKVATIKAVKTARSLAMNWELEQDDMIRRRDPRPVYRSLTEDRHFLFGEANAKYPQDPLWRSCSDGRLVELFAMLPPDAAAFISLKVAQYVCRHGRRLWSRP